MKGKLTLEVAGQACEYDVELVEPTSESKGLIYTPSNGITVKKLLADSKALRLPIPLGVLVL